MKIPTTIYNLSSENVISEILDLGQLCHAEDDVKKVLDLLVDKISRIVKSDVCSLYLLDPQTKKLSLAATKGLSQEAIGQVHMNVGEGLVGKTLEWLKPVSMAIGRKSKRYKYFPGIGEEKYSSFLSVPLIYNRHPIGVLVIQNEKPTRHSSASVHLLLSLAIPAVNVIEKAKLLGTFGQIGSRGAEDRATGSETTALTRRVEGLMHQGIGASPGIAMAPVKMLHRHVNLNLEAKASAPIHVEVEKMRVLEAFRWVEEEIREVQKKAKQKFGMEELSIFDAYQMVLESESFKTQLIEEIDNGMSALQSVEYVIRKYSEQLALADDEYIRERVYDIQDVGRKITDRLLYGSEVPKHFHVLDKEAILLSDYWSISDFVELDLERTKGIMSPTGGASSHIAILAQSLGIPAVVGLASFADHIRTNDKIIIDGSSGVVVVNPTPHVEEIYRKELRDANEARVRYMQSAQKAAIMKGGKRVSIGVNMGMIAHVKEALDLGAEEIGLYRTEFPFLIRRSLPTEEEQFKLYQKILASMGNRPVTIRTLDIGGDKYLPYLNLPKEENPSLGWRSIRISLDREDLFRIQLRALLRASMTGKLRIMFPMISSMEEMERVKEIVRDVKKELRSEKIPFAANVPLGVMIEVPSAVEIAEALIKEVSFFSIGTNDLIQYVLAVDRNNSKVAKLYRPLHPAVLRAIDRTVRAAHKHKKTVTVCGEMAGDPLALLLLVGLGVDGLSMSAPLISRAKNLLSRVHAADIKRLTKKVLALNSATEIEGEIQQFLFKEGLMEFLPHGAPSEVDIQSL